MYLFQLRNLLWCNGRISTAFPFIFPLISREWTFWCYWRAAAAGTRQQTKQLFPAGSHSTSLHSWSHTTPLHQQCGAQGTDPALLGNNKQSSASSFYTAFYLSKFQVHTPCSLRVTFDLGGVSLLCPFTLQLECWQFQGTSYLTSESDGKNAFCIK